MKKPSASAAIAIGPSEAPNAEDDEVACFKADILSEVVFLLGAITVLVGRCLIVGRRSIASCCTVAAFPSGLTNGGFDCVGGKESSKLHVLCVSVAKRIVAKFAHTM